MKLVKFIFFLSLSFILLIGCNQDYASNQKETTDQHAEEKLAEQTNEEEKKDSNMDQLIADLQNYEPKKLEYQDERTFIELEYPQFSYEPLDQIIEKEMKETLEENKEFGMNNEEEIPNGGADYAFTRSFDDPVITEDFVSIFFRDRIFWGGPMGMDYGYSFNFDLKTGELISLEDVLDKHQTSLEQLSYWVAKKLIYDEEFAEHRGEVTPEYIQAVVEQTRPIKDQYSLFTLTQDSIIFYFDSRLIGFPGFVGMTGIEVFWEEIGKEEMEATAYYIFGDEVEPATDLTYENKEYGLSLEFPESWRGKYIAYEMNPFVWYSPVAEPVAIINFGMVHEGKYIGSLSVIEVYEQTYKEEILDYYQEPIFGFYLGEGSRYIYVYRKPGELPEQLYYEPYIEVGNEFSEMVEEDFPEILETIKLY